MKHKAPHQWVDFVPKTVTRRDFVRQTSLTLGSCAPLPHFHLGFGSFPNAFFFDETSARVNGKQLSLQNDSIAAEWRLSSNGLLWIEIRDKHSGDSLRVPSPAFKLTFTDGTSIDSNALRIAG